MYHPYPSGTTEKIEGLDVHIPPVGHVYDVLSGKLENVGVYKRSPRKKLQYWERFPLPDDWSERRKKEIKTGIIDPVLETFRRQEWKKRLSGFWFSNNGIPTYITGLNYFFLNWWYIGGTPSGYPDFRSRDRRFFNLLEYCIQDPNSLGLLYITKRREGKSAKASCFLYEPTSRTEMFRAGIQSKSEYDAEVTIFRNFVVTPYLKLPDFFRPQFDTSAGRKPKKKLTFTTTSVRGKGANDDTENDLDSTIDFRSSGTYAYDGTLLHRYLADEIFKTKDLDIRERHRVVKYCCTDPKGRFSGSMLVVSTVEEFEGKIEDYRKFWENSNQLEKNANGRTKTGLYRMFTPAYEAGDYDKYGHEDIEGNKQFLLNEREALKSDPDSLNSEIRKNPFSIAEAFRSSKGTATYDIMRINDQLSAIASYSEDIIIEGDLIWTDGMDSQVIFKESKGGPFRLLKNREGFMPDVAQTGVRKVGGRWAPNNASRAIIGVDPFDHVHTVDSRRSNGAAYLYIKYDSMDPDNTGMPILEYLYRQQHPKHFYEDMIKMIVWSGANLLFEDNKPGIRHYFEDRGYIPCMMHLPGRKDPGLPSSFKTKQDLVEESKSYVIDSIQKVYFVRLLEDLRDFDPLETKRFDAAMAFGWTLVADKSFIFARSNTDRDKPTLDLNSIFG